MSAEAAIFQLLTGFVGGRVYPDVSPSGALLPRIVYQQVGGTAFAYTEGTLPTTENGRFQVACWSRSRAESVALAKQAEAAILAAPAFQAEAIGARISGYEPDTGLFSSMQDFSIWSAR